MDNMLLPTPNKCEIAPYSVGVARNHNVTGTVMIPFLMTVSLCPYAAILGAIDHNCKESVHKIMHEVKHFSTKKFQ